MFAQFFASFTRIAGFVEALSTSSFTALHSSANFWILLKFSKFFQFAVFTKITNLVELFLTSNTAFSLMQWIFNFFVIFATACKPGHISFIIIVFHYSLARQCLWSLPGEVLFKSLPQNAKPVHVSPTGPRFCLKGGYITTIPWINYSTDSWESHYYYLTRGQYD